MVWALGLRQYFIVYPSSPRLCGYRIQTGFAWRIMKKKKSFLPLCWTCFLVQPFQDFHTPIEINIKKNHSKHHCFSRDPTYSILLLSVTGAISPVHLQPWYKSLPSHTPGGHNLYFHSVRRKHTHTRQPSLFVLVSYPDETIVTWRSKNYISRADSRIFNLDMSANR